MTPAGRTRVTTRTAGIVGLIMVGLVTRVPAEPLPQRASAPARMTLAQAIERAREAAPRLEELRALQRAAAADLDRVRAQRLPEVDALGGYSRFSGVSELTVPVGGELRTIFPNIPDRYRFELAFEVPLYTGGRIEAQIDAASSDIEATGSDLRTELANLELDVTQAYWDLVLAGEQERVLGEAIRSFEAHLADAHNRRAVGLAASNEELAVEVELERAELARLRAASATDVTQARLAILLDLPPGSRIEPTDELETAPDVTSPLDELVAQAMRDRPERDALRQRVAAAEARVSAAEGSLKPQLSATGGFQYNRPNLRILPLEERFHDSWNAGFQLVYNLFDGGERQAAIGVATAQADASRRRLANLEREIRLQVIRAYQDSVTAAASVEVAQRGLESATENLRVTSDRYLEGLIPSSERLDAETAALRAGLDLTEARVRLRIARARLTRALGAEDA